MNFELVQLLIAYTLVAVFIFTAIITSLSLVGKVQFAVASQQKVLFQVLIVEVAVASVGFYTGVLKFNPSEVQSNIVSRELNARRASFEQQLTEAREIYESGDLGDAYERVSILFRSKELEEYFPIKDLFILNGDISKERKFWLEAIESYGPALKLEPSNIQVMVNAGYAQRRLQNYEQAESLYERALAQKGQDWEVLNGYFNCLRRYAAFLSGEYPKISDEKFQKAAKISQKMSNVSSNERQRRLSDIAKGTLYWEWEKYDIASSTYKQLSRKYPKERRFREDLAAILVEMSKYDEAKALYAGLYQVELSENEVSWYVGSGYAEAASKAGSSTEELKSALEAGLTAIAAKPDEPFSYYAVSLVYKSIDNNELSLKYIKEAEALEAKRDTNIHTYDRTRHELYRRLLKEWSS